MHLLKEAILHNPRGVYAYPVGEESLRVMLRLSRRDECTCTIYYDDRYKNCFPSNRVEMEKILEDDLFGYYEALLELPTRRFAYCFCISSKEETLWYTEEGLFSHRPEKFMEGLFQYPYLQVVNEERVPTWAHEAIIYQIFPDRFSNGDPALNPYPKTPWESRPRRDSFYGGDLQGIIERLPYLEDLGINTLYLTPIFSSPSNHRYDTIDYYHIDPRLGTEETFDRLIKEAYNRGIRVILDGVFNHTSNHFHPFTELKRDGEGSKYSEWFHVYRYPISCRPKPTYETFGQSIGSMPRLNTYNEEVQEYLLDVGRYWTKKGIHGWRLDVANEVNPYFWQRFRREMKKIDPDILLTGEIWHKAGPWLEGDMFDTVMNYPFREIVLDHLAYGRESSKSLEESLSSLLVNYRKEVQLGLWNILGTHDTPRLWKTFYKKREAHKLAILLQFTYPGVPHIYYGDEVGITGGDDPDCRRGMVWDEKKQNQGLLEYYRRLIRQRRELDVLKRGDYRSLHLKPLFGYSRRLGDEEVLVLLNHQSEDIEVEIPREGIYKDLLKRKRWSLNRPIRIKKREGLLLQKL